MTENSARSELSEVLRIASQKIRDWEREVDRSKGTIAQYVQTVGYKKTAAMLQYSAALKIARLGTELLTRILEDPKEGLLFGLTKRPMFESYTRGIWVEHVADEDRAKGFMSKRPEETNLKSEVPPPTLEGMWNALKKEPKTKILVPTVRWMQKKADWWNDATHISVRSISMGWFNEFRTANQRDKEIVNDLDALMEIAAQSTGYFHRINEGGVIGSRKAERIFEEGNQFRGKLKTLTIPPGP